MAKSFLRKAGLICLLSLLFVTKSNAFSDDWYCDPHNGTYSIIDFSAYKMDWLTDGLPMDVLLLNNPYHLYMPQNIANGETVTAHFKAHCVGLNAVNAFDISANVKDINGNTIARQQITTKSKNWSNDYAFNVPLNATRVDFLYNSNGNTKAKEVKFWMPMPLHLDAEDQNFMQPVELDESVEYYIPLRTFFLEENNRYITLEKVEGLNSDEFSVVRGSITPANRCGTNRCVDASQMKYFANTNLAYNMFVIRFNPQTEAGIRECEFVVRNGSQSKTIKVRAKAIQRSVTFVSVGEGAVELYVNGDETPITTSPYYFQKGDRLRFKAVAGECSHFVTWSINPLHICPVIDVVGNHSFVIHANFAPNMFRVCARPNDPCHGRVFFDNCPAHHFCGSRILFSACPAPGYQFKGWSTCDDPNTIISTDEKYWVELSSDVCLIGNFEEEGEDEGFRFICEAQNGATIQYVNGTPSIQSAAFVYSTNGKNWMTYTEGTPINLAHKGDVVYFRADSTNSLGVRGSNADQMTIADEDLVSAFIISDSVSVAGNIMYLLSNNAEMEIVPFAFRTAFAAQPIINANELILPETLANNAFHSMFRGCHTLKTAPVLPATELANGCYAFMFMNCTSLEAAPELPATTVNKNAYIGMFKNCITLTTAPEMNIDAVGTQGCSYMYDGCVNLVNVQSVLPAMRLNSESYTGMFRDCSSLTEAPELPATVLSDNCYKIMFKNCVSLSEAPVLPATTLVENCYKEMFNGCTSLSRIEVGFAAFNDLKNATYNWTKNVAEDGEFIAPNLVQPKYNTASKFNYIPLNWRLNQSEYAPRHNNEETEYVAIADGMSIVVKGAENANVSVYDASGRLVSTIANASDYETINIAVPGVYVVNVAGQESVRVIVK